MLTKPFSSGGYLSNSVKRVLLWHTANFTCKKEIKWASNYALIDLSLDRKKNSDNNFLVCIMRCKHGVVVTAHDEPASAPAVEVSCYERLTTAPRAVL
ncbi:hypothetical protein EVAR_56870_1 [Eumeta japonica]|uniref:Uncharacterized protein n=1 Tax=Eumeta variegata TaxID=151549 RepID=A0A4C1Z9N2_EUMVA|nr:hypothetical protein EVAR_56870_1 [Eumeta japonica]